MSPNVGNFVHDLVEMAKAMETLPVVEHDLILAKVHINELVQDVQNRELVIIRYKQEIEELQSKVRATEAERDDAELRFLDLEEKSDKAVKLVLTIMSEANQAVNALSPPKPQPEPEAQPQPSIPEAVQSIEAQPQVQSEPDPTTSASSGEERSEQTSVTSSASEDVTSAEPNPPGPYTGKRYHDHPTYVSFWDWLDGGGTEENYRWHPNWERGSIA